MSRGSPETAVEAVLITLRRGQRQLTRTPRATIEVAVKQLLALGTKPHARSSSGSNAEPTYRIDELAQVSGCTSRNIRAYQERGLLHRPQRVGRTSIFDDTHRARLRIITSMFDRGYTAANILEMLQAWEAGQGLEQVLGLERALVPPGADEPSTMPISEAADLVGGASELDLVVAAGLVQVAGADAKILRPQLMIAFAEMQQHGMDMSTLIRLHQQVLPRVEEISAVLVEAGVDQLADRFMAAQSAASDPEAVAELVALLTRFRRLALTSVTTTLATTIEETIEALLADYLSQSVLGEESATG